MRCVVCPDSHNALLSSQPGRLGAGGAVYWILSIVGVGCFTALFTLLLFLVYKLRPKTFKVKAAFTKWISVEVELESPGSTSNAAISTRPRQQRTTVVAPVIVAKDDSISAA